MKRRRCWHGTLRQQVTPTQAYRQLPLVTMPPMQCTLREPMQSLMQRVHRMEDEPGILTATVSMVSHSLISRTPEYRSS